MRYDLSDGSGEARVAVHGSVAMEGAEALSDGIRRALREGADRVVVDLGDCPELSSMAVGVLVGFKIEASLDGRDLRVANPSAQVLRLLEIVGAAEALVEGRS